MGLTLRGTLAMIGSGAALLALAAPAAAGGNPPGDNGTVKIDRVVFDDAPNNEPHAGCVFQVDFYGFDMGNLDATVTFTVVPPTGPKQDIVVADVPIGEDAAGGGTDLDASATYDLSAALANVVAHPQQGIHLKLTVHAAGSQGADTKFKVFWVQGCGKVTPPTSTTSTTSTTVPGGPTTTVPIGPSGSTVPGGPTTTAPGTTGATISPEAASATTTPGGSLPNTGTSPVPLAATGIGLVAAGAGIALAARRRAATGG